MNFLLIGALFSSSISLLANSVKKNDVQLDFKRIPLRDLIQFLADNLNYNVILSESVSGTISLHFHDVNWERTLETVLDMAGLVKRQLGNILIIATPREFAQRQQNLTEASPFKTVNVKLQHVDAQEMISLLKGQGELLSTNAKLGINIRNNSLKIKDTSENIEYLLKYINELDIPAQQILIKAKIVNVDDNKISELGIQFRDRVKSSPGDFHINFPDSQGNALAFTVVNLAQSKLLDLELAALESKGYSKVVANPQLITQNRKLATIEAGEEIPYQEKTSSGATNIAFKKAALALKVTPILTPDNKISLELEISQNKTSTLSINGTPGIQTQELKTQVVVQNGQTVILGGIYEATEASLEKNVPFLDRLPLFGKLLSHYDRHHTRKELLIFVTPVLCNNFTN